MAIRWDWKKFNMRKGWLQGTCQCSFNHLVKFRSVGVNREHKVIWARKTKEAFTFPVPRDHHKSQCLGKICILHKLLQVECKFIYFSTINWWTVDYHTINISNTWKQLSILLAFFLQYKITYKLTYETCTYL